MSDLLNREPKAFFRYFREISAIPRGSGNEKALGDYLVGFALSHNLECTRDEVGNVLIRKPAFPSNLYFLLTDICKLGYYYS